jgi:hypothetical protein
MELTTAMVADGAQQAAPGGKLYILGGQWDRMMVPNFPAQHPTMAVVIVLRIEYSEALDNHQLEVELTLDGESRNVKAVGQVITGHAPGQIRGTPTFVPLTFSFNNLVFEAPGRYEWVVRVDEQELRRLPIEVVQGTIQGMPMPPGMPMLPQAPPAA